MGQFSDLVVRVGADLSGFKDAFRDGVEALEKAGDRATRAGGAITRALEQIGVTDSSAKLATQAKSIQASFELLERAFADGKITAEDFAKAQDSIRQKLEALGNVKVDVAQFDRLGESLKALGIDKSKFQVDAEIQRLQGHMATLEKAFHAGKLSTDEFAAAQSNLKSKIEGLTSISVDKFERIGEALKAIKVDKSQFNADQQIAELTKNLAYLEAAYKAGKLSAADYALAQKSVQEQLAKLSSTKLPAEEVAKLNAALKSLGIDKSKFQVDQEIDALTRNLAELTEAQKKGAISTEELARAQKKYQTEIAKIAQSGHLESFEAGLKKLRSASDQLRDVGQILTGAFTLPIAGAGVAVTKFAADFDSAMRQVTSLLGGVSDAEFKKLSDATLEMSKRMGVDGVNSAKALYEAISAGVPKENALTFIEVASKAAIAGVTETKTAVDGMTNVINAFGLSASQAEEVADAMFQAVNVGKFTFEQLASSVGIASGTAAQMGVNFKELLGAAAALTKQGFSVSEAMTYLQSVMTALIKPSKEMEGLIAKTGFSTGETLLKTRGLFGAIQDLDKAAQHNSGTLAEAYGRTEALKASLGLTGENAKKAAADISEVTDKAGAMSKGFEEIEKSTTRQFQRAAAEAKNLAIEFGASLLPTVNELLKTGRPLVAAIQDAVKWFVALPEPVRNTALAVVAATAAIGPFLIALGGMASALQTIGALFTSGGLLASLGSGAGLAGLLTAATPLAIAFGVAIAGWAIAEAVSEVSQLNAELDRLYDAQQRGVKATQAQAAEIKALESALAAHNRQLGVQNVEVSSTGKTVDQYVGALREAVKGLDEYKSAATGADSVTKDGKLNLAALSQEYIGLGKAASGSAKGATDLAGAKKTLTGVTGAATDATRKFEEQQKASAKATEQYAKALSTLGVKTASTELKQLADALSVIDARVKSGKAPIEDLAAANAAYAAQLSKLYDVAHEGEIAFDKLAESLNGLDAIELSRQLIPDSWLKQAKDAFEESDRLAVKLTELHNTARGLQNVELAVKISGVDQIAELDAAMKRVGGKTIEELDRMADQAERDYERIRASGVATPDTILRAEVAYIRASIEARRAHGETITKQEEDNLRRLEEKLGAHTEKQKNQWEGLFRQVSTIATDFSKDVAEAFIGIFRGNPENDRLRQEQADLTASLEARKAEWEKYQQDVAAQLAELREKHAAELAAEEADLQAALDEKRGDYEQYVADVNEAIEAVRAKHASELEGEINDLRDAQRDKEVEYGEYQAEIIARIAEVREAHAEQLEEELDDLRDNLRDKTQEYEDYVSDIESKLGRLSIDTQDDIQDETRSTNRKIADRQKDFKREEEDTKKKIARILAEGKKGNQQEIADLQASLERKREDTEEYIRRENEDLQDFIEEKKRKQEQEERDLRESLARKTRDHQEYIRENSEREQEIVNKHKAAVDKQVADLVASLNKRGEALIAFRNDTAAKIADITERHRVAQEKEISDLRDGLAKKTGEWEKYKTEVAKKLEELRESSRIKLEADEAKLANDLAKALAEWETYKTETAKKLGEIEAQFTGVWDRVKGAFGSMLESMGEAIIRFGIESLEQKLFKWFKDDLLGDIFGKIADWFDRTFLGDILERVGRKLADIFGLASSVADKTIEAAGSSASGGIPTGGGGGGTRAPGGAGGVQGVMGAINMATGIVSAVADVFTAIGTFRLEGTMNAVEENTRYGMIHTLFLLEEAVKYWPQINTINNWLQSEFSGYFASLMTTTEEMRDSVKEKLPILEAKWNQYFGYFGSLMSTTEDIRDILKGTEKITVNQTVVTQPQIAPAPIAFPPASAITPSVPPATEDTLAAAAGVLKSISDMMRGTVPSVLSREVVVNVEGDETNIILNDSVLGEISDKLTDISEILRNAVEAATQQAPPSAPPTQAVEVNATAFNGVVAGLKEVSVALGKLTGGSNQPVAAGALSGAAQWLAELRNDLHYFVGLAWPELIRKVLTGDERAPLPSSGVTPVTAVTPATPVTGVTPASQTVINIDLAPVVSAVAMADKSNLSGLESLRVAMAGFAGDALTGIAGLREQFAGITEPITDVRNMVREFTAMPWMPALERMASRAHQTVIVLEVNSRELARATVDDITSEQALRLKLAGQAVW